MIIRDEKKVKEIIEGLKSDKVTVKNLSEYFGKQCIFVQFHQKNWADRKICIPNDLLHRNVSEETKTFFAQYGNKRVVSIFPTETMGKIKSIFSSVWMKKTTCSFGKNGLMTVDMYKEVFKPFFDSKYEQLKESIEELKDSYDDTVGRFKEGFERMLTDVELSETEVADLIKTVYSLIPKKTELDTAFDMYLELQACPVVQNISILDDDIADGIKEQVSSVAIQAAYDILGTNLSDAFNLSNELLKKYQAEKKFTDYQKRKVKDMAAKLAKQNLLKNAMVSELTDMLTLYSNPKYSDEDIAEALEEVLGKAYKFAKETELLDTLDTKDCVVEEAILAMY